MAKNNNSGATARDTYNALVARTRGRAVIASVYEREDGWLLTIGDDIGKMYQTAADAQRAACAAGRELASSGSSIIRLEWITTTRVGSMVVRAITSR